MRFVLIIGLCALLSTPSWAQTGTSAALAASASTAAGVTAIRDLQAVSVTGEQPGPGLWKVSKGAHVLWIFGVLTPLPQRMQWKSADVERVIATSQQLLESPSADVKADTGFFGKLFLLPSIYSARKNPDDATLQQVLPPPLYARWRVLKAQYIGDDSGIEHWRPLLAGLKLYQKALEKNHLANGEEVTKTMLALAKKHQVPVVKVQYKLVIEQPREVLKAIEHSSLHDLSCFNQTMDVVEHDMGVLTQRANAWASGDVDTLARFSLSDRYQSCVDAVVNAAFAQQSGLHDLPQHIEATWLTAAESALARNAQTFALLPMQQVLSATGLLAKLKAQGYRVQAPDDQDE